MNKYRVTYTCSLDPGCPDFRCIMRGYDKEDIEDQFFCSEDDQDWKILKIEKVRR